MKDYAAIFQPSFFLFEDILFAMALIFQYISISTNCKVISDTVQ